MVLHNGAEDPRALRGSGWSARSSPTRPARQIDGYLGIAHNRYATTGKATKLRNVQPILVDYKGGKLAIAHNGNLTNVARAARADGAGRLDLPDHHRLGGGAAPDRALASGTALWSERAEAALRQIEGAISCLIMDEQTLIGYRDPLGFRPLSLGTLDGMYVLASETCAFDLIGANFLRDVEPGEMVVLDPTRG